MASDSQFPSAGIAGRNHLLDLIAFLKTLQSQWVLFVLCCERKWPMWWYRLAHPWSVGDTGILYVAQQSASAHSGYQCGTKQKTITFRTFCVCSPLKKLGLARWTVPRKQLNVAILPLLTVLGRKWYVLLEKAPGPGTKKQPGAINLSFGKHSKMCCLWLLTWGPWTAAAGLLKVGFWIPLS